MNELLKFLEIIGTVAFAISGVLTAKEKKLDLFGAIILGLVTAVGGGALRDVLLGLTPPVMFKDPTYALSALAVSVIIFIMEKSSLGVWLHKKRTEQVISATDSIGLAVFAISGSETAMSAGYASHVFLVLFVGMITATGGGVLRDILAGKIPVVMRKRIYAVAALAGCALYYILKMVLNVPRHFDMLLSMAFVLALRYLAVRHQWNLPSFE